MVRANRPVQTEAIGRAFHRFRRPPTKCYFPPLRANFGQPPPARRDPVPPIPLPALTRTRISAGADGSLPIVIRNWFQDQGRRPLSLNFRIRCDQDAERSHVAEIPCRSPFVIFHFAGCLLYVDRIAEMPTSIPPGRCSWPRASISRPPPMLAVQPTSDFPPFPIVILLFLVFVIFQQGFNTTARRSEFRNTQRGGNSFVPGPHLPSHKFPTNKTKAALACQKSTPSSILNPSIPPPHTPHSLLKCRHTVTNVGNTNRLLPSHLPSQMGHTPVTNPLLR